MSVVKRNAAAGEEIPVGNRISSRERRIQEARQMNLLSNTFMSVALRDIPACQHVLRILLGKPELVVKEVRTQYYISKLISHDSAIDVLAEDGGRELYIAEIQRSDTVDHPRRIRFYGAMADSEFLEKGKSYDEMPELHVIYISETDIWKRGKTVYQLEKHLTGKGQKSGETSEECRNREDGPPDLAAYDDGIHVMYVNAEADDGSEIAKLMRYFKTADPDDMSQGSLSRRIHFLKREKEGEEEMGELEEKWWREGREEGKEEGKEESAMTASVNLSRMGMPVELIAEAVQYSAAQVSRWIREAGAARMESC